VSRSVRLAGAAGGVSPCRRWATVSGSARGAPRALFEVGQLTDLLRVKRSDLEPRATIRHRRPPIANRDLLPFRVDLISARPGAVVKPVPAVLARPITAHLRQPRPHLRGRRVDRQGHRPAPLGPRDQIGARERRAKLLISGAPAAKASPDETAIHADQQPDGYQREASFRVASRCGGSAQLRCDLAGKAIDRSPVPAVALRCVNGRSPSPSDARSSRPATKRSPRARTRSISCSASADSPAGIKWSGGPSGPSGPS
jgi:hypothetical protein